MSTRLCACLVALVLALAIPLAWLTSAPAPRPKPAKGLYSDAQVEAVVRQDLRRFRPGEVSPNLPVVPDDETRPLGEVLKALGFEVTRLQEPRRHMFNFNTGLYWRVSPSYDLECHLEPDAPNDAFDLKNRVDSVRIRKRYDAPDPVPRGTHRN
jgi:hypothetical protein